MVWQNNFTEYAQFKVYHFPITLSQTLNVPILLPVHVSTNFWMTGKQYSAASDLCLYCLLRPIVWVLGKHIVP